MKKNLDVAGLVALDAPAQQRVNGGGGPVLPPPPSGAQHQHAHELPPRRNFHLRGGIFLS
jgi:hypothetical protein